MSCRPVWLLTKLTLCPGEIVTVDGLTAPWAPMVMVAPTGPGLPDTGVDGPEGEPPPPPQAINNARAIADATARVRLVTAEITTASSSEKLARDVESEIPVVLADAAARQLAQRRAEAAREIQLEEMTAGAALDAEPDLIGAGVVPDDPRSEFADEIHRWADAQPRAEADHHRVVVAGGERA